MQFMRGGRNEKKSLVMLYEQGDRPAANPANELLNELIEHATALMPTRFVFREVP